MLAAILPQAGHIGPCIADNIIALHIGYATQCLLGGIVHLEDATDSIEMLLANGIQGKATSIQLYGSYAHPRIVQRIVTESKGMNIFLEADIVGAAHNEELVIEHGCAEIACGK